MRPKSEQTGGTRGLAETRLCLVFLVVSLLFPPRAVAGTADLALVLESAKTSILVGEPLGVRLRVENRGSEPVEGDFFPQFALDRVRISISKDGAEPVAFVSRTLEIARAKKALADLVTLPPGGAVEAVETIGFDVERELPAFSAPGRYEIRATLFYENYEKQLGSNPLVVDVREPTGVDAEAWAFVVANGLARFLGPEAHLFSPTEATVGALRELAERFEKSAYAPFAEAGFEAICTSTSETQVPPGCPPRVTCGGDCDTDGAVSPAEVAVGVRALFDRRACRAADRDEDGVVRANEILAAVWNLAVGCGEPAPAAQAAQTK